MRVGTNGKELGGNGDLVSHFFDRAVLQVNSVPQLNENEGVIDWVFERLWKPMEGSVPEQT